MKEVNHLSLLHLLSYCPMTLGELYLLTRVNHIKLAVILKKLLNRGLVSRKKSSKHYTYYITTRGLLYLFYKITDSRLRGESYGTQG